MKITLYKTINGSSYYIGEDKKIKIRVDKNGKPLIFTDLGSVILAIGFFKLPEGYTKLENSFDIPLEAMIDLQNKQTVRSGLTSPVKEKKYLGDISIEEIKKSLEAYKSN